MVIVGLKINQGKKFNGKKVSEFFFRFSALIPFL